ncbi:uncharacterized protein [Diabrotica undecimpunctata]|uniref:uncharacterized protein n=1 Tax=Diabrotica undecimpunctata TaxID=50387 RepID=UPI003B63C82A
MDDERLIKLIRQYPILYDAFHPKYSDYAAKQNVWETISREVNVDVSICKSRWINIRDTYRRSLKKGLTRSGDAKRIKRYKYSRELQFIKKHLKERGKKNTETGIKQEPMEEKNESEAITFETNISEEGSVSSHDFQEADSLSNSLNPTNEPVFENIEMPGLDDDDEIPGIDEIQKHNLSQNVVSSKLLEYLIKKDSQSATKKEHPVDVFLSSMSDTLKSLDPYRLNLAKSEIFATVQKYEMQMILDQFPGQSAPQSNSTAHRANFNSHSSFEPSTSTPMISPASIDLHDSKML